MRSRPLYLLVIVLLIAFAFVRMSTRFQTSAEQKSFLMGTPVRVKVNGPNAPHLARQAIEEIRRLDKLLSRFDPESEIYKLNNLAPDERLELSTDTHKLLQESARIKKITEGTFDIRLGKTDGPLDLGAIAKGYAVELARRRLMKLGAKSGIIDMRSSIAVFGDRKWEVGIQHPRDKEKLLGTIELSDGQSLATSGDYERGTHIIDPRIGKPANKGSLSVTIVGKNAAVDALCTAVFVLGPDKGMKLIESLKAVEGLILDHKGKTAVSSGFNLK